MIYWIVLLTACVLLTVLGTLGGKRPLFAAIGFTVSRYLRGAVWCAHCAPLADRIGRRNRLLSTRDDCHRHRDREPHG